MSRRTSLITIIAAILCLFAFFWYIWPTPYEYTRKAPDIYRVNRFTGVQEQGTPDGWKTDKVIAKEFAERSRKEAEALQQKTASLQKHLNEKITFTEGGDFENVEVRNDSEWECTSAVNDNITLEYRYDNPETGQPELICTKQEDEFFRIPSNSLQTYRIIGHYRDDYVPIELRKLREGTPFTQTAILRFSRFKSTSGELFYASPDLTLKTTRHFTMPKR